MSSSFKNFNKNKICITCKSLKPYTHFLKNYYKEISIYGFSSNTNNKKITWKELKPFNKNYCYVIRTCNYNNY